MLIKKYYLQTLLAFGLIVSSGASTLWGAQADNHWFYTTRALSSLQMPENVTRSVKTLIALNEFALFFPVHAAIGTYHFYSDAYRKWTTTQPVNWKDRATLWLKTAGKLIPLALGSYIAYQCISQPDSLTAEITKNILSATWYGYSNLWAAEFNLAGKVLKGSAHAMRLSAQVANQFSNYIQSPSITYPQQAALQHHSLNLQTPQFN